MDAACCRVAPRPERFFSQNLPGWRANMSTSLENRVRVLEAQVARLLANQAAREDATPKDWRQAVGMFSGDEIMKQIDAASLAFREADRKRARNYRARRRRLSS